jgi:phosphoribosylformylglycinamidine synthase II
VGGETLFSPHYGNNPLVNVLCLGIAAKDQIFYGRATGIGNPVIYIGAKTGRDGIHGATMASEEFDEKSQDKRPTVQVGDPFMEKLLLEACLEAMHSGCVVGIQDMGAAGLTCSTSEMGSRAGTGIQIELDLVPQRETGMTPYEIMLSESQERMLLVTKPEHEGRIRQIFSRWGLDAVTIGKVTDDGRLRVFKGGELAAEIPNSALADQAPIYERPMTMPAYLTRVPEFEEESVSAPQSWKDAVLKMMGSPNLCRKRWVWEQYDHMVRTNTVTLPGGDATILRLKESRRLLSMSTDCNPRLCYLNPREGALAAVAESCRNIICSGGLPLAATNCLNFASPENPEVMWQFSQTIDGIRDACEAFGTPITGGNVSFYNETNGIGIYPTPVIGMVGIVESEALITSSAFQRPGDLLLLAGPSDVRMAGSEFLELFEARVEGIPAPVDLNLEKKVQAFVAGAIRGGLISSAHDCSEGGLLVTALECALLAEPFLGVELRVNCSSAPHQALFGEGPSRILITASEENALSLHHLARQQGVVRGSIRVMYNGSEILSMPTQEVFDCWDEALGRFSRTDS